MFSVWELGDRNMDELSHCSTASLFCDLYVTEQNFSDSKYNDSAKQ